MSLSFCQTGQVSSLDDLNQVCIETSTGYCSIPIEQLKTRKNLPLNCKPVSQDVSSRAPTSTAGATRIIVPPNAVAYTYSSSSDNLPRASILGSYYYENLYAIPNNASQTMGSLQSSGQLQVINDTNFIGNCANQTTSVNPAMCGSIYGENPGKYPISNSLPALPIPQAATSNNNGGFWLWFIFGLSLTFLILAIMILFFGVAGRTKHYKAKLTGSNIMKGDTLILAENTNRYQTI